MLSRTTDPAWMGKDGVNDDDEVFVIVSTFINWSFIPLSYHYVLIVLAIIFFVAYIRLNKVTKIVQNLASS